jgi:prepilin-type N-terminal cleavage/methylation domain-containing protein
MKRAFTLIELLIATALSSIVIFAFYALIDNSKLAQQNISQKLLQSQNSSILYKELSLDIMQSSKIEFKKGLLVLKTTNTLYNRFDANVIYILNKKAKKLLRVESTKEYNISKDFDDSLLDDMSVDVVLEDVDDFLINSSSDRLKIIVYITQKGKEIVYGFRRFIKHKAKRSKKDGIKKQK